MALYAFQLLDNENASVFLKSSKLAAAVVTDINGNKAIFVIEGKKDVFTVSFDEDMTDVRRIAARVMIGEEDKALTIIKCRSFV